VRRALATSFLSLLLLTTLVWGGCVSCEQFFMWASAKTCCGVNGQCKTKKPQRPQTSPECKQIDFDHQKSVDLHINLPVVAVHRPDFLPSIAELFTYWARPNVIEPSPPDRQALHATFLI